MVGYRTACLAALFAVMLIARPVMGQGARTRSLPVTVHGQIRYAHGGVPAENVLVRLERFSGGMEAETVTDRTGKFQFSGMSPGVYLLKVHLPGFHDEQRQIDLQTTPSEYVLFQLLPEEVRSSNTTVQPTKLVDVNVPPRAQKEFEKAEQILLSSRKERFTECVRHLETAVSIYPRFLEAQLKLGTTYMDLGEWEKAEEALNRALEIDPKTVNTLFAIAELNVQRKNYVEAERFLIDGLNIENRSWQGHFMLGRLYWSKNEIVKAGRQVALALQLNPNFADAHMLGANILLRAGKREDALFEFEEYLRLAPKGAYATQARETVQKLKQSP
jgi:tetratricopeptide (TPR) repeat protein